MALRLDMTIAPTAAPATMPAPTPRKNEAVLIFDHTPLSTNAVCPFFSQKMPRGIAKTKRVFYNIEKAETIEEHWEETRL